MAHSVARPVVACIDSNVDITRLLADVLHLEGFRAVPHVTPVRWEASSVVDFLSMLRPDACIFSVSLPYTESWKEFRTLRTAVSSVPFVITATNLCALRDVVGAAQGDPILGKPFNLDELCQAVRGVLDRRESSAA